MNAPMSEILKDQVAVVTGGTAGIGKAIALQYAASGAKVIIIGTNVERGERVLQELVQLTKSPDRAAFYSLDTSNTEQVDQTVKKVLDSFGQVDILVNNAGITRDQLLMKMTEADWDTVLDVNVKSCFNTCRALVRPMMKAKKGAIINMSSVIGLTGNAGQVNYAASKAAIIGLTKALAKELASRSIRVNCICPGFISTAMTDELTDAQKESILSRIPLGTMGTVEDIAHAALFLASHLSKYITGQIMVVDGGMVI